MAAQGRKAGFTLIELVIVLAVIATLAAIAVPELTRLSVQANAVDVQSQAKALRTRDIANRAQCQGGRANCVDIDKTGESACVEGVQQFLPDFYTDQVENGRYSLTNIDSDIVSASDREADRQTQIDNGNISEQSAIFTVTRFLGESEPPDGDWLDTWNPEQPCILYIDE